MTTHDFDHDRDARLVAALKHAGDDAPASLGDVDRQILAAARARTAHASVNRNVRGPTPLTWSDRLLAWWQRPTLAPAFGVVALTMLATLMWHREPVPDPRVKSTADGSSGGGSASVSASASTSASASSSAPQATPSTAASSSDSLASSSEAKIAAASSRPASQASPASPPPRAAAPTAATTSRTPAAQAPSIAARTAPESAPMPSTERADAPAAPTAAPALTPAPTRAAAPASVPAPAPMPATASAPSAAHDASASTMAAPTAAKAASARAMRQPSSFTLPEQPQLDESQRQWLGELRAITSGQWRLADEPQDADGRDGLRAEHGAPQRADGHAAEPRARHRNSASVVPLDESAKTTLRVENDRVVWRSASGPSYAAEVDAAWLRAWLARRPL